MKDRNKYDKFIKELKNPAKFIMNITGLEDELQGLCDLFKSFDLERLTINKKVWTNISTSTNRKSVTLKLQIINNLLPEYKKGINMEKFEDVLHLNIDLDKKDFNEKLKKVCNDTEQRELIVDIIFNFIKIIKEAYKDMKLEKDSFKINDRRNNIEDIINEANALDGTFVNITNDGDDIMKEVDNYRNFINDIISKMNNVDKKILDRYDADDLEFTKNSVIFSDEKLDIDSMQFMHRFVTLILDYSKKRVSKLALALSDEYNVSLRNALTDAINLTNMYGVNTLSGKTTDHYIILKLFNGCKGTESVMNNNKRVLGLCDNMIDCINESVLFNIFTEVNVNYLIRLVYMITTLNNVADLDYGKLNINKKEHRIKILDMLGSEIIRYNEDRALNKFFIMFNNCNPKIITSYNKYMNNNIYTAIKALAFTSFILDNKKVTKLVDKIL